MKAFSSNKVCFDYGVDNFKGNINNEMLENNFSWVLSKNIASNELFESLYKVLLIEDTPIIQMIHKDYLATLGATVTVAGTAYEAISALQTKFNLILLDIGLPDMSGIELIRIIKTVGNNYDTPIIALTAYGQSVEKFCVTAGVNEVKEKPASIDWFKNTLDKYSSIKYVTHSIGINRAKEKF